MKSSVVQLARVINKKPATKIHPAKWWSLVASYWKEVENFPIHCDAQLETIPYFKSRPPILVIIHALNQRPFLVDKVREVWPNTKVVGLSYNSLWLGDLRVEEAFSKCDMVFGRLPKGSILPPNFCSMAPLVDTRIFNDRRVKDRNTDIFVPRGHNRRQVYWYEERERVLSNFRGLTISRANGGFSKSQMADLFRNSKISICLREDSGPAYSAVESVMCGCIPIVSNIPSITEEFGETVFAANRTLPSIRETIEKALSLSRAERVVAINRMQNSLKHCTLQYQGPKIAKFLKGLVDGNKYLYPNLQ